MLFCFRGQQLRPRYINRDLVPRLCRKAGVPREDVRSAITIATQLYNAKDPMSLFELQAWLGHSSPYSTQHYARITPVTLTGAYTDAGYFARNVRTIEVLLDRDAITNGQTAAGRPLEFYDLGHVARDPVDCLRRVSPTGGRSASRSTTSPFPRPRLGSASGRRPAFRATSTTGSPQGGNQR